jgi:hypothetical protein
MNRYLLIALLVLLASCTRSCPPAPQADGSPGNADAGTYSHVRVANRTGTPTTAYVSFGADSKVTTFPFCGDAGGCSFNLAAGASQDLPTGGAYLNITLSFDQAVGCKVSLGEVNVNNPAWNEDTANISLVNGWSNDLEITSSLPDASADAAIVLGPTKGPNGNETVFGVYPNGCDICVAKQSPPCGITPCGSPDGSPGICGCKAGTQYAPTVPCQASFARGQDITLALVSH